MSIAAFDLDGTLLKQNSSFSFCRYLYKKGFLTRFHLFYCAILFSLHVVCGLSLLSLHTRVFRRLFKGKSVSTISQYLEPFIETLNWYEPALARLEQLREKGFDIHILSNSPLFLVKPIAASIGVNNVLATDYKIDNTGRLWNIATLVDAERKRQELETFEKEVIAFSDSHHDLPFLEAATQAVVVNPSRRLSKIALKRSWEVL